jgi:hypothetical protein
MALLAGYSSNATATKSMSNWSGRSSPTVGLRSSLAGRIGVGNVARGGPAPIAREALERIAAL